MHTCESLISAAARARIALWPAALALLACVDPSPPGAAPKDEQTRPQWRSLEIIAQAEAPGGYELRILDDRAYVATFTNVEGVSIFDVADPAAPRHIGGLPGVFSRSLSPFRVGEQTLLAISSDNGVKVYDVANPVRPTELALIAIGTHNVTAHPTAGLVYNSRNLQDGGGAVEIIDASDPADVHLARTWTFEARARDGSPVANLGCHDIVFDAEVDRAYCAAYQQTLIWDVSDPLHPEILTAISNPLITVHHTAYPILGRRVLLIGDEHAGNLTWGCYSTDANDAAGQPSSLGAVWFYDLLADPPQPMSWIAAPPRPPQARFTGPLCTSHNGAEYGDSGLIAYGWFHGGLMLIDASDPLAPRLLDSQDYGGAVGDARWHRDHVLAVDDETGLTVLAPREGAR